MNEYIEKCFHLLADSIMDENRKKAIKDFIASYDDAYREKVCKIADSTLSELEILDLYIASVNDGSLKTDDVIAYAFASNKNLPKSIVDTICYSNPKNTDFYTPLFENHKNKISVAVFEKVYDKTPYTVERAISPLKYLSHTVTKEDLPFSEPLMQTLALKEYDKDNGKKHLSDNDLMSYRYITNEDFIDKIVKKICASNESKENLVTEILNNYFISEDKRNLLFDTLEHNPKKLINPTPYMVEKLYESTVKTLFEMGIDRYSSKTQEESDAYHYSLFLLGDLVRRKKLTTGMELNLIQILVDKKDRTGEHLTGELVRNTSDPRVLHIALQLKSTNDKDTAIANKHLSVEDIIEVAIVSKKKIEADIKKGCWVSEKHIARLVDFAERATLPDDVYETMFKTKDTHVGITLTKSKYTPRHIVEKALEQSLDPKVYTRALQEVQARLMLFSLDNNLPTEKTTQLMELIETNYSSYNKETLNSKQQFQTNLFKKDNPFIEKYKEGLEMIKPQLSIESCQQAVSESLDDLNREWPPILKPADIPISQYSDKQLKDKMRNIAYMFTLNTSTYNKTRLYINMEKNAKEFLEAKDELDKRELLQKTEEIRTER